MKISFSWSTRRQGNDGFVLEIASSGEFREFGPMPPHIVPAFVEGRRRIVAMRAAEMGLEPKRDYSYLADPQWGQVEKWFEHLHKLSTKRPN